MDPRRPSRVPLPPATGTACFTAAPLSLPSHLVHEPLRSQPCARRVYQPNGRLSCVTDRTATAETLSTRASLGQGLGKAWARPQSHAVQHLHPPWLQFLCRSIQGLGNPRARTSLHKLASLALPCPHCAPPSSLVATTERVWTSTPRRGRNCVSALRCPTNNWLTHPQRWAPREYTLGRWLPTVAHGSPRGHGPLASPGMQVTLAHQSLMLHSCASIETQRVTWHNPVPYQPNAVTARRFSLAHAASTQSSGAPHPPLPPPLNVMYPAELYLALLRICSHNRMCILPRSVVASKPIQAHAATCDAHSAPAAAAAAVAAPTHPRGRPLPSAPWSPCTRRCA